MSDRNQVFLDRGWLILLRDLGIQPENVLRRAKLPEDLIHQENLRLSVEDYCRLWEALDEEAADPSLPIRLAEAISMEAFHPPIFAALCSPDLTVAVKRIAEYKRLVVPMTVDIENRADGLFVGMRWDDPGIQLPAPLAASELTFLTQIARIATRERLCPLKVESPWPMRPESAYGGYFGVVPQHTDRHGVTFSPADASRPFLTANESLWETFEPELRRRLTKLDASEPLSARVRSVLLESLPSGEASIEVTARRLGLSSRTLQRRLKPEGLSYKDIVRQTRERLARHYLTNTSLSYAEISFLVGFGEPSSFFRAFREWTGETPESVRLGVNG
jgi:AraC-like DNA-binding protein